MKFQTLPVKRRPVSKGIFRRLSAVTRNRKQRVAAAAAGAAEVDDDDGGSKISRALIIIFLIHIVAIGLIFIHQRFLDGRPVETTETATAATAEVAAVVPAAAPRVDLPRLRSSDEAYCVKAGDNYTRIAAAMGVDEPGLRLANQHVNITPGLILKIPPQRIVATEPPEVTAIRALTPSDHDRGLVEAEPVNVRDAPRAQVVRPAASRDTSNRPAAAASRDTPNHTAAAAPPAASGKTYTVQAGDSIWRIANRCKVSQDALMRANGISDARKMKTGMKLAIPSSKL